MNTKPAATGEGDAPRDNSGFKENLLQNVKCTASKLGGKVRVAGKYNERVVRIEAKDGRFCKVWFPLGPRVKDLEIQDLKDGCEWILGVKPFSI